ncbi:helix-turn-helix domain-containing protein [Nocardia sp. CDC153]|uniref:AraC family transcriptional regulator n=1 Tax=Nocardia sp. CDC153 TaxID=3112167 RepID=UPI002DBEACA7|nr:helix-turn-helix domain-containing protein [Nocardia sp. CDC153]MEC3954890.1 helix-turn-helix domain-containing protein [Nocardia sp. CDC153]
MFEGTVPARTAAPIYSHAVRVGVPAGLLRGIPGLDVGVFGEELVRIPAGPVGQAWQLIDEIGGDGVGSAMSAASERGCFGVWDYLFATGATLAESLRTVHEFRPLVASPTAGGAIIVDGGLLTIREATAPSPAAVIPAREEFTLALMLRRAREATGVPLVPVRVRLTQDAPRTHEHLVEVFGTRRIEFGAPHPEMSFLDAADLPIDSDPHQARVHRHYAELLMSSFRVAGDWNSTLRSVIHESMLHGTTDLRWVADRLAVGPRTIQRRLQEQGTTWRDEVEAVRYDHAVNLLRNTDLPISSVAARLGYSDVRTLRRAFLRWNGLPPSDFRRDNCGGDAAHATPEAWRQMPPTVARSVPRSVSETTLD